MKFFVYGNLKKGFPLHDYMVGSTFVSRHALNGYAMMMLYPTVPMIVKSKDKNDYVLGEIWEVPKHLVPALDSLESGYIKAEIEGMYVYIYEGIPVAYNIREFTMEMTKLERYM